MNTINTQIDTVQENVEEVKKLQRKILNAAHKSEAEHARLNDIYATTFKLAQNIRKLIAEEQDYVDKKLNWMANPHECTTFGAITTKSKSNLENNPRNCLLDNVKLWEIHL